MKTAKEAVLCSYWKNSRAILHPEARVAIEAPVCLALIALVEDAKLAAAAQKTLVLWQAR